MTNCNGTPTNCCNGSSNNCCPETPTGCFSSRSGSISKANCGCTPCDTPIVVNQGDVSNQVLVPVLADVIQNCICLSRYETAYPSNLLIVTDLLRTPATGVAPPSGPICITGVTYSYGCIGVIATAAAAPVPAATIAGFADSTPINLTATTVSCTCTGISGATAVPVTISNEFAGTIRTNNCCCQSEYGCDPVAQPYAQTKLVETGLTLGVCNLNITVTGTIGCQPFTGTVTRASTTAATGVAPIPLPSGTLLSNLGFPPTVNFAGRMCLPTNTRINIQESFDNCLIVDCIRPVLANYSPATDPNSGATGDGASQFATFRATGDLSLVLNKKIYAITPEKLAVITNCGAQVICNDGASIPSCPTSCPSRPCPSPARPAGTV